MYEPLPDEKALINRAHALEMDERHDEALGIIRRILQTNPKNGEAQRALSRLERAEPQKTKIEKIYETPPSDAAIRDLIQQNQDLARQAQAQRPVQQVVNVTHQAAYLPPAPAVAETRNDAAFIIGVIAGFFGLLGLAHLFNGKVGSGLALIFLGSPVYGILWFFVFSTGIGILALPLHFVVIWRSAKSGARRL